MATQSKTPSWASDHPYTPDDFQTEYDSFGDAVDPNSQDNSDNSDDHGGDFGTALLQAILDGAEESKGDTPDYGGGLGDDTGSQEDLTGIPMPVDNGPGNNPTLGGNGIIVGPTGIPPAGYTQPIQLPTQTPAQPIQLPPAPTVTQTVSPGVQNGPAPITPQEITPQSPTQSSFPDDPKFDSLLINSLLNFAIPSGGSPMPWAANVNLLNHLGTVPPDTNEYPPGVGPTTQSGITAPINPADIDQSIPLDHPTASGGTIPIQPVPTNTAPVAVQQVTPTAISPQPNVTGAQTTTPVVNSAPVNNLNKPVPVPYTPVQGDDPPGYLLGGYAHTPPTMVNLKAWADAQETPEEGKPDYDVKELQPPDPNMVEDKDGDHPGQPVYVERDEKTGAIIRDANGNPEFDTDQFLLDTKFWFTHSKNSPFFKKK